MAESSTESITVPIKVPEPVDHAPPSLAQPASGPVAEMSGALAQDDNSAAASAGANLLAATNGNSGNAPAKPAETSTQETSEARAETQDEEMNDAPKADEPSNESHTAPDTNGTSTDKKTPNGKRKSTGGVPEHKNKKLNKKKSVSKITHLDAEPGDYFFARLKSYPPWPSIICDEEMLPTTLLNTRPITTKKADGTYNEAYDEGGKKVSERTYPVMFLFTNEFAWIPNTDLSPLTPDDCKDFAEKGKSKSLIQAYHVAAEANELQHFKDMLVDHARALQEDEEAKEAKAAEKASKAEKKKRKSEVKAVDADVEMEDADVDADATPSTKKASKKRKKDAESDDEEPEKPAKTPKTTKLKLTTNKTPTTTEKKPKEPKSAKPKSEKKKKAAASDEDLPDAEEKVDEKPLDPAEEREARKKEVLFLRHKLQKGFLSRDQAPREDEMPQMNNYIKKLEAYPDLEVVIIRETKINKVLKALVKLNTIPRDEEYQFRKRSVDLLGKWNKILGAEPADAGDHEEKGASTNGAHEDKKDNAEESKDKMASATANAEKTSAEDTVDAGSKTDEGDKSQKLGESETPKEIATASTAASGQEDTEEHAKVDGSSAQGPQVIDRAPESAGGAAEAKEVVQAAQ